MTLNERIAKVKGWYDAPSGWAKTGSGEIKPLSMGEVYKTPDWSGSIADAWELVEEITDQITRGKMRNKSPALWFDKTSELWCCDIGKHSAFGKTAPEAICLAYLAVKEET